MAYQPYNYSAQVHAPVPYQYPPGYAIPPDYNAYYGIPAQIPEPPPPQPPPPALHIQTVNASVASQSVRRLLSSEIRNVGFKRYESAALARLENEVVSFVELLYSHAKEYATLTNRVSPTAHDLLAACEDQGMSATQLRLASKKKKRKRAAHSPTRLVSPPPREPSPEILPSDDDDAPAPTMQTAALPQTLQDLPDHLPSLPPKHTYLHTAPAAPKRTKIPSLDKKLDNAAKVQQSLRSLVKATEDTAGKGDTELAGGVVNWMSTSSTGRKRWKIR
ncbi:hypothetical protein JB92DRAFT_2879125 [Gautieria morchelliformis]|nr:hypothetical protein JB92DRAFT_2879125 [Gautieria morchelliformis]